MDRWMEEIEVRTRRVRKGTFSKIYRERNETRVKRTCERVFGFFLFERKRFFLGDTVGAVEWNLWTIWWNLKDANLFFFNLLYLVFVYF